MQLVAGRWRGGGVPFILPIRVTDAREIKRLTGSGTLRRSFDALLIDFYGTIAAGDRQAVEQTCATIVNACDLQTTPQALAINWGERFFRAIEQSNHDAFRTLYECELVSLSETLEGFGKTDDPAPFVAQLETYWRTAPTHVDAIEFLRAVDLPICCVSNADTEPLLTAIRRHDLKFDAVVSSEMVRCYKPEEAIFRRALDELNISADRVLHVGDSLHSDIAGASAMGICAAWICRNDRIHDVGDVQPWRTIQSLTELHKLL